MTAKRIASGAAKAAQTGLIATMISQLAFGSAFAVGRRGRPGGSSALLRVIRHVPARTFELHGWSGNYLLDETAALGTLPQLLIGEFADLFEAMSAFRAQVFIVGHV